MILLTSTNAIVWKDNAVVPTRVPSFEDGIHVVVYDTCIFMVVFVSHKCTVSVYMKEKKKKEKEKNICQKKKSKFDAHSIIECKNSVLSFHSKNFLLISVQKTSFKKTYKTYFSELPNQIYESI